MQLPRPIHGSHEMASLGVSQATVLRLTRITHTKNLLIGTGSPARKYRYLPRPGFSAD
jgi:hypothetical protein